MREQLAAHLLVERAQVACRQGAALQPDPVEQPQRGGRAAQPRRERAQGAHAAAQRRGKGRVDQGESERPIAMACGEMQRDVRAQAVTDEQRARASLGIEQRAKVLAPALHAQPVARERAAVAAQVRA